MRRKQIKPGMFVLIELGDNIEKLPINKQIVTVIKQTKHGLWQVRYNEQYYSIPQRFLRKANQQIFNNLNSIHTFNEVIEDGINGVHELMLNRDYISHDLYEHALKIYVAALRSKNVNCDMHIEGTTYSIVAHVPTFVIEWDINIDSKESASNGNCK